MNDYYEINKNIEKIYSNKPTNFLNGLMQEKLKNILKKSNYKVFYPYPEAEKVIYYKEILPNITLYEIKTKEKLRHQDILGTILNLGINDDMIGDIIINDDKYYIYVIDTIKDYLVSNLVKIKKTNIDLIELDLNFLDNYERKYEEYEIIVSSERADTIISQIIHTNRSNIKEKMKNKEIIINYEIAPSLSKNLKIGDIFSIRKIGKFKYGGIVKYTKKDNLLIKYYKYI